MYRPKESSGVIPQMPPTFFVVIKKRSLTGLEPTTQPRLAGQSNPEIGQFLLIFMPGFLFNVSAGDQPQYSCLRDKPFTT